MLTKDEVSSLCTQIYVHIDFLKYISSHLLRMSYESDFDHAYALALAILPMNAVAKQLEEAVNAEHGS